MESTIKYFAALFFLAYMAIAFVLPSVRTYRQTGINPVTFGKGDNAHDFIGRWFKIILALIPVVIVCYWIGGWAYEALLPARYLQVLYLQWAGIILCLISLIWTTVAQWQMGISWRIGIDQEHATPLVSKGLFGLSRNPIFLGMLITLLGFFLLLPNAITFLVLVAGYLLIHIQIRLEEEHLAKQYGDAYLHYRKAVRRLL